MKANEVLKLSLGIDVSKDSLSFSLGFLQSDLNKYFIQGGVVSNDLSGFKKMEIWLLKQIGQQGLPIVAMESTGVYHEGIASYLHSKGFKVSILQSGRVKRYAQSLDQRSKTDALDGKMLSMLGCERQLAVWTPPSQNLQHLRALSRERSSQRYDQRMALLQQQILEIETEMQEIIKKDALLSSKIAYMESIPGVSFVSAATVVAETLGFSAIYSAKQLTSYVGYDVVLRESGNYKGKSRISKKGNKHIRAVLHMPSMSAIRFNPSMKPFYERLKPRKQKPLIALVAVQRKLLVLMYSLWKSEMYYDPDYEIKKRQGLEIPSRAG